MPEEQDQIAEILEGLEELKRKKSKDRWDKLATIGQLISGVLLVGVGLIITWSINRAQRESARDITQSQIQSAGTINDTQRAAAADTVRAQIDNAKAIQVAQAQTSTDVQAAQSKTSREIQEAQANTSKNIANAQAQTSKEIATANLEATNRQILSDYLHKVTSTPISDRAAFLEALDLALPAKYSVPVALRFARPIQLRSDICKNEIHNDDYNVLKDQDERLGRTVRGLLARFLLHQDTRNELEDISQSHIVPDSAIADAVLTNSNRVLFRVSQIDDFADVFVNDTSIGTFSFGYDSPWLDITDKLNRGQSNRLSLLVRNGPYESTGVRLQIRIGLEQYDRVVVRHDWTTAGPSFWIMNTVAVDPDGKFHLGGDDVQVIAAPGSTLKPCPVARPTATIAALQD